MILTSSNAQHLLNEVYTRDVLSDWMLNLKTKEKQNDAKEIKLWGGGGVEDFFIFFLPVYILQGWPDS